MFSRFLDWLATFSPAYKELSRGQARDNHLVTTYARALRDIANTADGVKVPNGTTRRVGRLANQAFVDAAKVVTL